MAENEDFPFMAGKMGRFMAEKMLQLQREIDS